LVLIADGFEKRPDRFDLNAKLAQGTQVRGTQRFDTHDGRVVHAEYTIHVTNVFQKRVKLRVAINQFQAHLAPNPIKRAAPARVIHAVFGEFKNRLPCADNLSK
jgi:hypothetical protein